MTPSISELKQLCKKGPAPEQWQLVHWGEKVNRRFTVYITWLLLHTPITPDQITVLGTVATLVGFSLFLFDDAIIHIIGVAVIFFSFLLDGSDGEVARYQKAKGLSPNHHDLGGFYVEPVSHDIQYAFVFVPVGIGRSLETGSLAPLVAAFFATSAKLLFRLAECRYDAYIRVIPKDDSCHSGIKKPAPRATVFYFLYRHIFTSSMLVYPLAIAVALGRIEWFLYFYAVGFFVLWMYKMVKQRTRIRRLIDGQSSQ